MDRDSLSNLVIINEVENVPVYNIPPNDTPREPLITMTDQISLDQPIGEIPNPENITNWNTNFRDADFIEKFNGHLQEPPPITQWISEAFSVFMKYAVSMIFWTLFHLVFTGVSSLPARLLGPHTSGLIDIVAIGLQLLLLAFMVLWDIVGMCFILKILKARPDSPRDASSQFRLLYATFIEVVKNVRFIFNYFLLIILLSVAIFLGLFLLIIPGILMAIAFSLSAWIYLEHHDDLQSVVDTLRISKNVVGKHFCTWFGFLIVVFILNVLIIFTPIGYIACGIALRDAVGLRITQV